MRIGNEDLVGACAGAQKCKDGYCQVAVGGAGPVKKLVEFFGFADDPDFQPLGTYPSITRKPGCKSLDEPLPGPRCEVPRRAGQLVREAHG